MAKASAKSKALPKASSIPEGMRQLGGGYAPTWEPEEGEELLGTTSTEVKLVEMTIGRKKQERRCVEITTEDDQRFTVWESAALGELFDELQGRGAGVPIFLRFDGLGKARKAGQNPPKLFTAAIGDF